MNSKTWRPPTVPTARASATNDSKIMTVPWSNHMSSMRSPETISTTGRKQLGPINEWRDIYRSGVSSSPNKFMLKTPYDNSFKGDPKGTGDNINRSSHIDVRPYGGRVQKDLLKYSEVSKPDVPPQSLYPRSTAPKHSVSFPDHEQPCHPAEPNENTEQNDSSFANRDFDNLDDGLANASSDQFYDRPLPKQQMYVSKFNQIQSNPEACNTSSSNSAQFSSGRPLPVSNAESSEPDKNFTTNRADSTNFKKWNLDDSNCSLPKLGADACGNLNSLYLEKDVPHTVRLPPNSGTNYQDDISKGGHETREFVNGNRNQGNTNNSGIKSPTSSKKYEVSGEIPEGEYSDELPSDMSNMSKRAAPEQKNPSWKTERSERYSSAVGGKETAYGKNDQARRKFSAIDPSESDANLDRLQPPQKRAAAGLATELSDNEASEKTKWNGGKEKEKERDAEPAARCSFVRPTAKTNDDGLVREMVVPSYRKKKTSFTYNEDLSAKLQNQLLIAQEVKRSEMETRPDFFNIGGLQSRYDAHSEGSNNRGTEVTSNEIDPKLDYRRRKQTSDLWVPTFKRM